MDVLDSVVVLPSADVVLVVVVVDVWPVVVLVLVDVIVVVFEPSALVTVLVEVCAVVVVGAWDPVEVLPVDVVVFASDAVVPQEEGLLRHCDSYSQDPVGFVKVVPFARLQTHKSDPLRTSKLVRWLIVEIGEQLGQSALETLYAVLQYA